MDPHLLHTRLAALAAGVVGAVLVAAGVAFALPPQSACDDGVDYGYVYSGMKSQSVAFVDAAMSEESLLLFGSSELSTPKSVVPQVPAAVFGENDYGLRLMMVGEAYDQSLWQAIALGAYARDGVPRGKVAVIVGPGWFVDGGMDAETFQTRFSGALYAGMCANPAVPDEVKAYVRERLLSYGIDRTQVDAYSGSMPHDALNAAVLGAIDDLRIRQGLVDVRAGGMPLARAGAADASGAAGEAPAAPATPDFAAMREQALSDGAAMSTTNEWGVEDSFYVNRLEPVLEDAEGSRADETYQDTPEYDDLECFLDVADACGVETLVILSPVMGPYYDHIGIGAETREGCYGRIRSVVAGHPNARLADFSDREYERYFLYDIVHFGTVGWADVNEELYGFAMGGR